MPSSEMHYPLIKRKQKTINIRLQKLQNSGANKIIILQFKPIFSHTGN